ncbi:MAG: FkbM family methyltransferase [Spirulinaceae cyanobacterium]
MAIDIVGIFLRDTPYFRGKWRLQRFWERFLLREAAAQRLAHLPQGLTVATDLRIPYEREVWLQAEEWQDLCFLATLLKPGDCFIDVGANIGLWTLVAAAAVQAQGRVYAFEPNPQTFGKLQNNLDRNGVTGWVQAFPQAIADQPQTLNFICESEHNLSRLAARDEPGKTLAIAAVNLDHLYNQQPALPTVTGIKLDTEGSELAALQGAQQILAASAPWLIVEFNTTLLPSQTLANWEVYQFLTAQGYHAFRYDQEHPWAIEPEFTIAGYVNILFQKSA